MQVVGVWPAAAANRRSALFDALGPLVGVRFEPVDDIAAAAAGLGALILLPAEDGAAPEATDGLPTLAFAGGPGSSQVGPISFSESPEMDARLRGRSLSGAWSQGRTWDEGEWEVLATAESQPVWRRRRGELKHDQVAAELPDLVPGESLRDRLRRGDLLGAIAVLHFVRTVFGQSWSPPATRATIIIDDPNTRRLSYGHIDFSRLAEHALEFDYNVTFAHIPLDFGYYDSRTIDVFRSSDGRLSLALHGNNHTINELAAPRSSDEADRLLAQALRRAARFEERTGLKVSRIMVPPHEACNELVLGEMARLGFESVTLKGPLVRQDATGGFQLADVTELGMPVLIRQDVHEYDEAVLRAFLDQPIVFYGHESDFQDGLGFLETAAKLVNGMPGASWHDLSSLSRANFVSRRRGDELAVRPFARRVHVLVGPDVRTVVVEPIARNGRHSEVELDWSGANPMLVSDSDRAVIEVEPSETERKLEIELVSDKSIAPDSVPEPRFKVAPVLRRVATEARDRTHPIRNRIKRVVT